MEGSISQTDGKQSFSLALELLVKEHGASALEGAAFPALLSDYTRNEWPAESALLLRIVDAGLCRPLLAAKKGDRFAASLALKRKLQDEWFIDGKAARFMVNSISIALYGRAKREHVSFRANEDAWVRFAKEIRQVLGLAGKTQGPRRNSPYYNPYPPLNTNTLKLRRGQKVIASGSYRNQDLGIVRIPEGVETIEDGAFMFNDIRILFIPATVKHIGERGFSNNRIASLSFAQGSKIETIGREAFHNNSIINLNLPEGLTRIEPRCFGMNNARSVALPSTLSSIGEFAFEVNCFRSVVIPPSVRVIETGAFYGAEHDTMLRDITIGADVGIGMFAFPFGFPEFYEKIGKKGGNYIYDKEWKKVATNYTNYTNKRIK
jgi:hypothetical protein